MEIINELLKTLISAKPETLICITSLVGMVIILLIVREFVGAMGKEKEK